MLEGRAKLLGIDLLTKRNMTVVRDKIEVYSDRARKEVEALFNTGATRTCVSERLAHELGFTAYAKPRPIELAIKGMIGEIVGDGVYTFVVVGCEMPTRFLALVVRDLKHDAIIGVDFMEAFEIELDVKGGKPVLKRYPPVARLI